MEREQLQAIQTPLKERYREQPDAAAITLSAQGDLDFRGGAGDEQLATLLKLTERYCVVLQTIAKAPELSAIVTTA